VQIGIVLALGGIGLLIAKNSIMDEAAQALYVVAVIAIALGIGFALSAIAAYALSRQLGLLQPQSSSTHA
jgi:heme/copper-type cytochrome/quinol oxidase subunit 3